MHPAGAEGGPFRSRSCAVRGWRARTWRANDDSSRPIATESAAPPQRATRWSDGVGHGSCWRSSMMDSIANEHSDSGCAVRRRDERGERTASAPESPPSSPVRSARAPACGYLRPWRPEPRRGRPACLAASSLARPRAARAARRREVPARELRCSPARGRKTRAHFLRQPRARARRRAR